MDDLAQRVVVIPLHEPQGVDRVREPVVGVEHALRDVILRVVTTGHRVDDRRRSSRQLS